MTNKNALVTGASRGIGRSIALQFKMVSMCVNYAGNKEKVKQLFLKLKQGVESFAIQANVVKATKLKL